ncbi:hypothetical protein H5410_013778 [Solanum commersonii]|uniref:Uncharacterized protein n=1 Tax=Solanum commersonii TaxID=4109 RepID=A0A9J5ZPE9_SOLCO|nr:hypothetical protein H5410_013778 [Solanum commersonii]
MEPVGPHGQTGLFSRSNGIQSDYGFNWSPRPNRPIFKVKQAPDLVNPLFCKFSCAIVHEFLILVMEPVGPHGQTGPFSMSNDPQSSQLVPTVKSAHSQGQIIPKVASWSPTRKPFHFQGQTRPRAGKPPILPISCAIVHRYLVIRNFDVMFFQKISWTSIKTLVMEPVGPYGQINHFQGQTSLEQLNPYFAYFCVIVHGFLVIQNYNVIFDKKFHGRPLKP